MDCREFDPGPPPGGGRYGARPGGPARLIRTDDIGGAFLMVDGTGRQERAFPWGSAAGCIVDRRSASDIIFHRVWMNRPDVNAFAVREWIT